ncbi:UPF0502 protein [Trichinella pseudospiralis]
MPLSGRIIWLGHFVIEKSPEYNKSPGHIKPLRSSALHPDAFYTAVPTTSRLYESWVPQHFILEGLSSTVIQFKKSPGHLISSVKMPSTLPYPQPAGHMKAGSKRTSSWKD